MSQHTVEVVRVHKEPHPNADTLSIVRVRGFQVVVKSDEWQEGALAAYVEPDMIMPDRPEYEWLKDRRVRPRRFRGVWSMGVLVPMPAVKLDDDTMHILDFPEGADVAEVLGITRYEPKVHSHAMFQGEAQATPPGIDHVYDLENYRRYPYVLQEGQVVVVTEKLHGTSARYTVRETAEGPQFFVGSRRRWLKEGDNVYWRIAQENPRIREFCEKYPGFTLYGEIFGWVQDLRYKHEPGQVSFAAFDLLSPEGRFLGATAFQWAMQEFRIQTVPRLAVTTWSEGLLDYADYPSAIDGGIREGIVIQPETEHWHPAVGRVKLKVVSNRYLERSR